MLKYLGAAALVAGALYGGGVFNSGYTRTVGKPPAEVAAAIEDLDIRQAPGGPVGDGSESGGVRPVFTVERQADRVVWTVMSGDKVATRMTALLEPVDGGKQTRVTAKVERGDAPDDLISPAFRSTGLTLALFSTVLESELNQLVAGGSGWRSRCSEIVERFREEGEARAEQDQDFDRVATSGFSGAVGRMAAMNVRLNGLDTELRAAGCNPDAGRSHEMQMPEERMTQSEGNGAPLPGVSFEPGKPMVDVRRKLR